MRRNGTTGTAGLWALLALALTATAPVAADDELPLRVTTRVEPESVRIGVPFRYFVRVETRGEAEVVLPLLVGQIGEFLIRDYGETAQPGGDSVTERWYELVGYTVGDQLVEGGELAYRVPGSELQPLEIPDAVITVESLLDDQANPATVDVRDIKRPVGVPRDYSAWWIVAGASLAALGLLVGVLWWLRRREAVASAVVERPAHEIALEALNRLRRSHLLEDGQQPEYYVRLSAIVREYVERRFTLRAPEMTTQEFLQAAQSNRDLPGRYRSSLGEFLSEADLVKFARHVPTVQQGERAYEAAREFVTETSRSSEESDAAA